MADLTSARPRSDGRRVALLFAYGFGNAAAYVLARTIADSAFLSHIGPEHLPSLYMLSAGIVALSSLVYGQLVQRFRLRQLVNLTLLFLGVSSASMPFVMHRYADSLTVFAIVYLFAQVRGSLGTIQFSALVNEQFGNEQPERVVGVIGAGATLAGILMGLGLGLYAESVDPENLMYLVAAIDIVTVLPVLSLGSTASHRAARDGDVSSVGLQVTSFRLRDAMRMPYVATIAAVVTVSVIAATLVEFQWKVTAASQFHRDEEQLAQYFGYFYGTIYLVTGAIQLFVTGRVLQHRGVLIGLLAFPSALLLTTGTAWFVSSQRLLLWPLTLSKGSDALKRSMNDPSIQVIYSPLDRGLRHQAITFVSGIAKPFAEAIAAVAIVILAQWFSTRDLSLVVFGLVIFWIVLDVRLWRQFRAMRTAQFPDRQLPKA